MTDIRMLIGSLAALACFLIAVFRPQILSDGAHKEAKIKAKPWLMFLVSVAALYVELLLIRWLGTDIRIFAYVQNLALIACFLGFGVGCFQSEKPGSLMPTLYSLVLLALIAYLPVPAWQNLLLHLSNILSLSSDVLLWGYDNVSYNGFEYALGCVVVLAMLWLIAASVVPLGRWVGYCFDHSRNTVRTYTVNLAGSLVGAWLLALLAFFNMSPPLWIAVAFLLVLAATPKSKSNWVTGGVLFVALAALMYTSTTDETYWSPYQKISLKPQQEPTEWIVQVNNVGYMSIANTTPEFLDKHPDIKKRLPVSVYDSPFRFIRKGARVLIVGAGGGNDAAAALRNGASHVDAVEIDPVIYGLGKRLNPAHPYDSDKVTVIVNDARNYLRTTTNKYDAVIFALLDSHTEVSGYTNMRVDNYVYTKESFEQAHRLLDKGGVLVLKFEVRPPWTWIGQRFYRTLTEVFGREPIAYYGSIVGALFPGTIFLESDSDDLWKTAQEPKQKSFIAAYKLPFDLKAKDAPESATDDWPYPYHLGRFIPKTYLVVSALLIALAFFMVRRATTLNFSRPSWVMFMLGGGFMLMETQLISRLTLYFGTTWIVNCVAISTVLAVLVLANLYVEKRPKTINRLPFFLALVVSLFVNYIYPWEQSGFGPWTTGLMLSCAYAFSVLMAGVIFTTTLARSDKKSAALGANVLGAVVGGLSQNLSFVVGLKALLPLAAAFYLAAAVLAQPAKGSK